MTKKKVVRRDPSPSQGKGKPARNEGKNILNRI